MEILSNLPIVTLTAKHSLNQGFHFFFFSDRYLESHFDASTLFLTIGRETNGW